MPRPAWAIAVAIGLSAALLWPTTSRADTSPVNLFLDVTLNGEPMHLVGHFARMPDGAIAASPEELNGIGLRSVPSEKSGLVKLTQLPGVSYVVDEHRQTIRLTAALSALATSHYDLSALSGVARANVESRQAFGLVLNYDLYGATSRDFREGVIAFNGASATLEGRTFGPFGTFRQTGILGNTTASSNLTAIRLDSSWTYADPEHDRAYHAGDLISGGLAWTRPVRLGGVQVEKNFELRPDLITLPLPSASGSAAVPSALNLYINGVQTYTQQVPAGPFQLNNIPAMTGANAARIVLRDASGQEIQQEIPYFASARLLRHGLYDYAAEFGVARLNYGTASSDYDGRPALSASGRYGVADWLTIEAHTESTQSLMNLGGGVDVRTGAMGVLTAVGAVSTYGRDRGALVYGAYQFEALGLTFDMDTQRTLSAYRDLAGVTAPTIAPIQTAQNRTAYTASGLIYSYPATNGYFNFGSPLVPLAIDRLSISLPIRHAGSSINASFTNYVDANARHSRIASLSYSAQLPWNGSFFATALRDFGDIKNTTVLLGVSFPFGPDRTVSTSVQSIDRRLGITTQASKAMGLEPGSYGWNVTDTEGSLPIHTAGGAYRSAFGQVGAQVIQSGGNASVTAQASGSAVLMAGSDIHLGPRIDDGFAIVKAGAPNVPVQIENRPAGVTGRDGELLVTGLRSYDANKVSIDETKLPVNASIATTQLKVSPVNRAGVVADFGVDVAARYVIVHFVDQAGRDIPPGTEGHVDASPFVVGYDGEAYLTGLSGSIPAQLQLAASTCSAMINIDPAKLIQRIGPVVCR
jgi:outer membrane usher protein